MNINPINANQSPLKFGRLNKVTCASEGAFRKCSILEKRVKLELQNIAASNAFFNNNDVNAHILVAKNFAQLKLSYKPVAKTFKDFFNNLFSTSKQIIISEHKEIPDESFFLLIKNMRNFDFKEK